MNAELEAYWETKKRIERKLLLGAGTLLMILWGTACTQSPTGPYADLEPQRGDAVETLQTREDQEQTRCGEVQIAEAVCEKALPDPEL